MAKSAKVERQRAAYSHKMRVAAEMWGHLRQALDHLGSLPHPRDCAEHINYIGSVRKKVDQRLPIALRWLTEFEHEWHDASRRAATSKANAAARERMSRSRALRHSRDDDTGNGAQAPKKEFLEP
jgi:hypothetical protein